MKKTKKYGLSILALGTVKSNGNKKVYITNKNLEKSLPVGTKVTTKYDKNRREIIFIKAKDGLGNHTISTKPNGTPVLDLKNKLVGETIGDVNMIEVRFYEDKVVVRVSKTVQQKEDRVIKNDATVFEILAGSATMTNMFEQAGFVSRGALEINDKNMAVFHENHKNEDIYTVCANIEYIDVNELPKDVSVLIVTPVCTDSSKGNNILNTALKNKKNGLPFDEDAIERMERSDSLMYYVLKVIEAMNPKTVVFENVEEYTKSPYDSAIERGVYTLAKTILKAKGYKLSEYVGESHNTTRKRWAMVAHYGDEAISLDDIIVNQTNTTVQEHLATLNEDRIWGTVYDFAPSRLLNNPVGIRGVKLTDNVTPTFSTHATRRTFPILHKIKNGVDLYSTFTPDDIKNIHGLTSDFFLPKEKTVAYRILGQGVASMFREVANNIIKYYNKTLSISNHSIINNGKAVSQPSLFDL